MLSAADDAATDPRALTCCSCPLSIVTYFANRSRFAIKTDLSPRGHKVMAINVVGFEAPVSSTVYPHLSLVLVSTGLLFLGYLFTLQVTGNGKRNATAAAVQSSGLARLIMEVLVAFVASVFLGFGLLFLCLNVGIYV